MERGKRSPLGSASTPSKRRRVSDSSPIGVATQIRRKYHRIQQRSSPLSATARRLLLSKIGSSSAGSDDAVLTQLKSVVELVRNDYSELRAEDKLGECWIVISR
jgi:hypothetical protein